MSEILIPVNDGISLFKFVDGKDIITQIWIAALFAGMLILGKKTLELYYGLPYSFRFNGVKS